jgi:hypothetical protein
MSSPPAENSRRSIEGNSSAIRFGVVHLGSRDLEFEWGPVARCASSLASAATTSLAAAVASAGHRKGIKGTKAHRRCNRHRQTVGLPRRIVNVADRRYFPPSVNPPHSLMARRWVLCTLHNAAAELSSRRLPSSWHEASGGQSLEAMSAFGVHGHPALTAWVESDPFVTCGDGCPVLGHQYFGCRQNKTLLFLPPRTRTDSDFRLARRVHKT